MRIATVIAIAVIALGPSTASAQPPGAKPAFALPRESITVIATRPSAETIKSFVETRAVPTHVLGRMARWMRPVCPLTVGLGDKYAKFVTQRIRDIAAAVGAPVNADPGCRPNIEVVFTTAPQGLLDNVRKSDPLYLGYYQTRGEADALAQVTHPIQAWYTTESLDMDGTRQIDSGRCGRDTTIKVPIPGGGPGSYNMELPCAVIVHASGSRLRDGLSSGFFNILIVAEPDKLLDYEVGSLADYITMQALSQPASLDSCQELPSISNMLAKDCASVTARITDGDLAYLHALYRLSGEGMSTQRDEMQYEMKKILVTDKGG